MPDLLSVTRTSESRLSEAVRENSEFGTTFSDHMFVADCEGGKWSESRIIPYGPMLLSLSVSALHYGQSLFEDFKAHRTIDRRLALFRPRDNHARLNRSAARLAMPELPASVFMDGVVELLRLDREWAPHREGVRSTCDLSILRRMKPCSSGRPNSIAWS
jgi:branched-chain amino acid aminotransferase